MLTDLLAQLPEKSQMPDHSQDTLTQKTAENITSVSKVLLVNMDAQSEQSSRLETLMALETAKIQKMFPDGELNFELPFIEHKVINGTTENCNDSQMCLITSTHPHW